MILGSIDVKKIISIHKHKYITIDLEDRSYDYCEILDDKRLFQGQMTIRSYLTEKEEGLCRICYSDGNIFEGVQYRNKK